MSQIVRIQSIRDAIRRLTIVAAGASTVFVTVAMVTDHLRDGEGLIDRYLMLNLVFMWAVLWFVANAIRFLDAKDSPMLSVLVLLPSGMAMLVFGVAQGFFVHHPVSEAGDLYLLALAVVPIALGIAAVLSALYSPKPIKVSPPSQWNISWRAPIIIDPVSSMRLDPEKWLAIAGGALFAIMMFLSPIVIPVAVALTCIVRYVQMLKLSRRRRRIALIGVAICLVTAYIAGFVNTPEAPQAALGFGLLLLSTVLAMFRDSSRAFSR